MVGLWRLSGVVLLSFLCAAPGAAPAAERDPKGRIYPSNEQCTEGYAPDTVFLHACDTARTYYCPLASRYGWDTMCVPLSPDVLKARREADARAAEARRLAAEAAARRQRMIEDQVRIMGPARRHEAEKYVDMKLAAEKARPAYRPAAQQPRMHDCSRPAQKQWQHYPNGKMTDTREAYAALDLKQLCGVRGGAKGPLECLKQWKFAGELMGNCGVHYTCNAEKRMCADSSKVSGQ